MKVITYLETNDNFINISILKDKEIEHRYIIKINSPSYKRLSNLVKYYFDEKIAHMKLYSTDKFSVIIGGKLYG